MLQPLHFTLQLYSISTLNEASYNPRSLPVVLTGYGMAVNPYNYMPYGGAGGYPTPMMQMGGYGGGGYGYSAGYPQTSGGYVQSGGAPVGPGGYGQPGAGGGRGERRPR